MKKMILICNFLAIVCASTIGQELSFPRPDVLGRWKVVESWDITRNDRIEIGKTQALAGFDTIWFFKDNQRLEMIDPLYMVDPVRQTYVYQWRWLNDTTFCVIPGSKNLYLLCHILDFSPSRLVMISSVAEREPNPETQSIYVLRVMTRTE